MATDPDSTALTKFDAATMKRTEPPEQGIALADQHAWLPMGMQLRGL